ncbi:MAG TPA: hypothetical protein VEU96_03955 [Bryobacteraceae bacterium]|nr:hypothetical protein [Bryobacteraceae bacterium]
MAVLPQMLRDEQHRTKAERNEHFAISLDKADPTQENWAVTAAFYSALHYVEQFFVKHGTPCGNHEERNEQFKKDVRIKQAYPYYSYLASLSHDARYKCTALPTEVFEKHAKPQLAAVKKQIDHALKLADGGIAATAAALSPQEKTKKALATVDPPKPMPGKPKTKD